MEKSHSFPTQNQNFSGRQGRYGLNNTKDLSSAIDLTDNILDRGHQFTYPDDNRDEPDI